MPLQYHVDRAARRVTVVWSEPVELIEMIGLLERQAADGAWAYGALHDTRRMTDFDPSRMTAVLEAARRLSEVHGPRGPVALVSSLGRVGVSQTYAIRVREEHRVEVFWNREDAEQWLDGQSMTG